MSYVESKTHLPELHKHQSTMYMAKHINYCHFKVKQLKM